MADDNEIKVKSFRIDEETNQKFKEIAKTIGGNQQATMMKLIEAYEFQSGKAILTDKKADIEQFEKYVASLTRMYMGTLEDNQNITSTVRTEFEAQLTSKDAVIQDLQSQLAIAVQLKQDAVNTSKAYADENNRLNDVIVSTQQEYISKLDDVNKALNDKSELADTLRDANLDLKQKVEQMASDNKKYAEQTIELTDLKAKYQQSCNDKEALSREISELKENQKQALSQVQQQMQLETDKAILVLERKYQDQIQALMSDHQTEIDQYQKKYLELLEQLRQSDNKTVK